MCSRVQFANLHILSLSVYFLFYFVVVWKLGNLKLAGLWIISGPNSYSGRGLCALNHPDYRVFQVVHAQFDLLFLNHEADIDNYTEDMNRELLIFVCTFFSDRRMRARPFDKSI